MRLGVKPRHLQLHRSARLYDQRDFPDAIRVQKCCVANEFGPLSLLRPFRNTPIMAFENVLVVEDQPEITELLKIILARHKTPITSTTGIASAREHLKQGGFDLMLLDLGLPDGDGLAFLEEVMALARAPIVIMITGQGSVETVVRCMRAGAFDYVVKPFVPSQIDVVVRKAETYQQMRSVNRLLMDGGGDGEIDLVGRSPAMMRMRELITRVAPTDATVQIGRAHV